MTPRFYKAAEHELDEAVAFYDAQVLGAVAVSYERRVGAQNLARQGASRRAWRATIKVSNAAWPDFGPNPSGQALFCGNTAF
ncbi:hypothetical protein [Salinisphaera japonica]|uniref:Uncharacterized protein n=1 Tax=Salinisphaera japonica YTM-1 TaxID=1209778 RepID=A0A423PK81_9GAMM|nr:hypothetical protein [Salinisphaera japonica]ROO26005.1 hypothetical protein SAJA_11860 [Salinisphaera japonica YTM-1]